ncbi:MAG: single-stranded-DNA-specific exonuclease RecJ [bacterium]|nr:single-stranded-DNA-specific exonuclease RecJ [bacterium]
MASSLEPKHWEVFPRVERDLKNQLLLNRNLKDSNSKEKFIHPHLNLLTDPEKLFPDLGRALARIKKAITEKELIYIYGDFDVDGITACAILWESLDLLGAKILPYIPSRHSEGYGLNNEALKFLSSEGAKLVITVDCGITAIEQANYAKELKLDLIITDHHQAQEVLPSSFATLHTTTLAGSGVAFKLATALLSEYGKDQDEQFFKNLELATLGTVADMVPLLGENRVIVKNGLLNLAASKRIGLKSLYEEAGLSNSIGTYEIGHVISPRLNAMGRMESALDSLRLLLTRNPERGSKLALKLGQTNRLRQEATLSALEDAKKQVEKEYLGAKFFVVSSKNYEQGVVGLVAGRLTERFHRPSAVISEGLPVSKGSARSIKGFNITEAIHKHADILLSHGGHPMAAGFSLDRAKIAPFREKMIKTAEELLTEEQLTPVLKIDAQVEAEEINDQLFEAVRDLEPFGMGNPEPVFLLREVEVLEEKPVGKEKNHLRLTSRLPDGRIFPAIAFGFGEEPLKKGKKDIVFNLVKNTWGGRTNLEFRIKDLAEAGQAS